MLDLAGVGKGMRVLDIGTGRGEPALRAARRVGAEGYLLGVDISEASLEETAAKGGTEASPTWSYVRSMRNHSTTARLAATPPPPVGP